jgi:hypothetical protein
LRWCVPSSAFFTKGSWKVSKGERMVIGEYKKGTTKLQLFLPKKKES